MNQQNLDRVLSRIDPEEVAELAVSLGAIEAPAGAEGPAAVAVEQWLSDQGFEPRRIGLLEDRPSIVARLEGRRAGRTLIFNAHLDTVISRHDWLVYRDPAQRKYISAWREGDQLFGNGLVNDKAPMAAFLVAAAAIRRSGVTLLGNVLLHATPGEIGLEPVDEYQGSAHHGKDIGTRYAIAHGVVGDAALVAEATGDAIGWVEAGKAFFKVTVMGEEPVYTPFLPAESDLVEHPNAIVRLSPVISSLNEWAVKFAERRYECDGGTVSPRANLGAVRSGRPDRITESTEVAFLYVDVRLTPDDNIVSVQRDLEAALDRSRVPYKIECFLYRRGFEARGIEELASAVRDAHRREFGSEPGTASVPVTSMWRDTNPFNEAGIPSLTYGPSSSTGGGNFSVTVEQLARSARVYALTALLYCGTE
jgi:acetylornithine deacetylase/succinyl-diaminopimelate desuccinylase-like protein